MAQTFWISTGDIREDYETVNVVAVHRTFGSSAPPHQSTATFREAVDALALQAQALGANGVIWIRVERLVPNMLGATCLVTGTAVRVKTGT